MSWIQLRRIVRHVHGFNGHAESIAADRLMHRAFLDARGRFPVAERVVLLDKLWSTQMLYQADHAVRVIRSLEKADAKIRAKAAELGPKALERDPASVVELARWAMPLALAKTNRPPRPGQPPYEPYAFASRYLHWTAPDVFPIADVGRARVSINALQREHGIRPRVRGLPGNWEIDYPSWVFFYSRVINELSDAQRAAVLRADAESRAADDTRPNTLLRVLDKAFYWEEQQAYLPTRSR